MTIRNKDRARPIGSTRVVQKGYIEEKTEHGWVRQHRLRMEIYLGRPLLKDEDVHHKNDDKQENNVNNLEVKKHGEHTRHHHAGVKRRPEVGRKISDKKRGTPNPQKLTADSVMAIRKSYATGTTSYRTLAREFGVTERAIACVIKRVSWRHI